MWVLRTNTELTAVEVALRYKQCGWSSSFRTAKSLLDTRPIFHKHRCHHLRTSSFVAWTTPASAEWDRSAD